MQKKLPLDTYDIFRKYMYIHKLQADYCTKLNDKIKRRTAGSNSATYIGKYVIFVKTRAKNELFFRTRNITTNVFESAYRP